MTNVSVVLLRAQKLIKSSRFIAIFCKHCPCIAPHSSWISPSIIKLLSVSFDPPRPLIHRLGKRILHMRKSNNKRKKHAPPTMLSGASAVVKQMAPISWPFVHLNSAFSSERASSSDIERSGNIQEKVYVLGENCYSLPTFSSVVNWDNGHVATNYARLNRSQPTGTLQYRREMRFNGRSNGYLLERSITIICQCSDRVSRWC